MKALIAGGCGQVGSHVGELLLEQGHEVLALDSFETGRRIHLPNEHDRLRVIAGSIADQELVDDVLEAFRPDVVVHAAASNKAPDNWHADAMINAVGGVNLVKASLREKVRRFIYFQTALCYGVKPIEQPITLDHPINPANSSYAITKTTTEQFLDISGLDYVTFRLANVIGPRRGSGPLPIFYERLRAGKRCVVTEARRDFVCVKDLARTVIKAVEGQGCGVYHFASGKDIANRELYDAVVKGLKLSTCPEPEIRPLDADDAPSILLDPSRTFADFGKVDFTPLEETVRAAIDYYDTHGVIGGYQPLHDAKPETAAA